MTKNEFCRIIKENHKNKALLLCDGGRSFAQTDLICDECFVQERCVGELMIPKQTNRLLLKWARDNDISSKLELI